MHANEGAGFVEAIERGSMSGVPSLEVLEADLQHANPAVRVAAGQLLTELREQISKARKVLDRVAGVSGGD